MKNFKYWCFVTLTYNPDSLESGFYIADVVEYQGFKVPLYSLCKRDFKLFLKRVKKNYGKPLKYFLCGEYGSRTLRPHGHCIFLFDDPSLIGVIEKAWKSGFTFFTRNRITGLKYNEKSYELNNALAYTCKYACKKSSHPFFYDDKGNWRKDLAVKPFRLMSKSLGETYIFSDSFAKAQRLAERYSIATDLPDLQELFQYPKPTKRGVVNVPLPRYYTNKLTKFIAPDETKRKLTLSTDNVLIETPYTGVKSTPFGTCYKTDLRIRAARRYKVLRQSGYTDAQALEQLSMSNPQQVELCEKELSRKNDVFFNKSKF